MARAFQVPVVTLKTADVAKVVASSESAIRQLITGPGATAATFAAANVLRNVMLEEIRTPGSGRVYDVEFRMVRHRRGKPTKIGPALPLPIGPPRTPHQASAPGEPPATDIGTLVNNIIAEKLAPGRSGVGAGKPAFYWKWLEFGTSFMEPRPFVRPAVALARQGRKMSRAFILAARGFIKARLRART